MVSKNLMALEHILKMLRFISDFGTMAAGACLARSRNDASTQLEGD